MTLEISTFKYLHQFNSEKLAAIKNFDGNKSLYFISNTFINSRIILNNQYNFNNLEKLIEEFEVLLKDEKKKVEILESKINNS
jgi:hypothetical protein